MMYQPGSTVWVSAQSSAGSELALMRQFDIEQRLGRIEYDLNKEYTDRLWFAQNEAERERTDLEQETFFRLPIHQKVKKR